jgi:predicted ATP-binding protein involved in virulence
MFPFEALKKKHPVCRDTCRHRIMDTNTSPADCFARMKRSRDYDEWYGFEENKKACCKPSMDPLHAHIVQAEKNKDQAEALRMREFIEQAKKSVTNDIIRPEDSISNVGTQKPVQRRYVVYACVFFCLRRSARF